MPPTTQHLPDLQGAPREALKAIWRYVLGHIRNIETPGATAPPEGFIGKVVHIRATGARALCLRPDVVAELVSRDSLDPAEMELAWERAGVLIRGPGATNEPARIMSRLGGAWTELIYFLQYDVERL